MSTIEGTVSSTVVLDSTDSPLVIATGALVDPLAPLGAPGIYSDTSGVSLSNNGTVDGGINSGGPGGTAVDMTRSATVTNQVGGVIHGGNVVRYSGGGQGGLGVSLEGGVLRNVGSITGGVGDGNAAGGAGVLVDGGVLNNTQSVGHYGRIQGGLQYSGNGLSGAGVMMVGGSALNGPGSTIAGGEVMYGGYGSAGAGVDLTAGASLVNSGAITGGRSLYGTSGTGAIVSSGSIVRNEYGTIAGVGSNEGNGGLGAYVGKTGTLINFRGDIYGGSGALASGDGVDVVGGSFTNTGIVAAGSSELGRGDGVYLNGGNLTNAGIIRGGLGPLSLREPSVEFGKLDGTLTLDNHSRFVGDIAGFKPGDTVHVTNLSVPEVEADFVGNTMTSRHDGTLVFDGVTGGEFVFKSDGGVGTDITLAAAACFRRGTRIETAEGEVAIETLSIGDAVMTRSGAVRNIKWIGRRRYSGDFAAANPDVLPVRILAGALSDGVPSRDLWVSPEHAMLVDDLLIPARALVNGRTIRKEESVDEVTYVHLEFDTHDVIVAEGAFSESYVDDESREQFANAAEYATLYPKSLRRPARFCAPRTEDGEALQAVRRRLCVRAGLDASTGGVSSWRGNLDTVQPEFIEGWAQDEEHPDLAVRLRVFDNGMPLGEAVARRHRRDLQEAGVGDGRHAFTFAVPGGLAPGIHHLIEVKRADDGRALPGSPRVLDVPAGRTFPVLSSPPPAEWQGRLDSVTHDRLEGWAWNAETPNTPMTLVVLDNGESIARVVANRYRKDLAQAGIGDGHHSFVVHIPGGLSPLTRHVIRLVGESDGCELPHSPVVLEASASFDGALEQAVSAAVAALSSAGERSRVLEFLAAQTDRVLQSNADADAGSEARQIRRQLERRWGRQTGDEGSGARERRALVVDDRLPVADRDAGSTAILSHMRALQSLGYQVSFVAAEELSPAVQACAALEAEGFVVCRAPFYASVEEVLRRQRDGFDVIYLHRVSNAGKYLAMARQHDRRARVLYGVADLHHVRLARQAKIEGRPDALALSRRLRIAELAGAAAADAVLTHSDVEAAHLRQAVSSANVHVVPWSVPTRGVTTAWSERRGLAFLGNFGFAPNVDAAHFLVNDIMPRVWAEAPSIGCFLAGSGMPGEILRLARPGVVVLGHVATLAEVFERVRLTVAPLRFGAGIKGKVLDSLAAGVPCVMSSMAAEGLALPPVLDVTGDTAQEIAAHIVRLHADAAGAQRARDAALAFVSDTHSQGRVVELLGAAIEGRHGASASLTAIRRR